MWQNDGGKEKWCWGKTNQNIKKKEEEVKERKLNEWNKWKYKKIKTRWRKDKTENTGN